MGDRPHTKIRRMENNRSWSNLPNDVVNEVSDRLSCIDFIKFGAVCKNWKADGNRSSLSLPCLFTYIKFSGEVQFLDVKSQRFHRFLVRPEIRNLLFPLELHACQHGWFLFSKSDSRIKTFIFYNPFLDETITLPPLYESKKEEACTTVASFTSPPNSPDCVVFAVVSWEKAVIFRTLSSGKLGDKRWRRIQKIKAPFPGNEVKDVSYRDGVFYCIIRQKFKYYDSFTLSAFNIAREEWDFMYEGSASLRIKGPTMVRLVECNKNLLLAVLMTSKTTPTDYHTTLHSEQDYWASSQRKIDHDYWMVYEFDRSRKDWSLVESFGDKALVLSESSPCSSMAHPAVGKDSEFAGMIFSYKYRMMSYMAYTKCDELSEDDRHIWTASKFLERPSFL